MRESGQSQSAVLKIGAMLSYLVIALQFSVAMIYTPIMLRLLGQTEFGLYSLVGSIVSYLSLLSFGFAGAYMRFYARFRAVDDTLGVQMLNGVFLAVFTGIGLIAASGGAYLSVNSHAVLGAEFSAAELETARKLFVVLTVNLAITFPFSVFDSFVVAHERFIFQKTLQIIKTVVSPMVTLPVLLLGHHSLGLAMATTIVNIFFTLCTAAYSWFRLKMRFQLRGFNFTLLKEVSTFSSFIFLNMLVDQINWNVDKLIVGRFRGAISVAVYGVGALFNTYYLTFSTAISGVFIPRVNAIVASGAPDSELNSLFTRVGRVQFLTLGLVCTGFAYFGRPFIELWAGPGYKDAYAIALILMIPVTVPLIQNLGIEVQRAKNLHKFRSWVYLAVAVGNILLSLPLAHWYGGIGAAVATAVSLIIGNVLIMNWYYHVRVGLDMSLFWREIAALSKGLLPALVVGALIVSTMNLSHLPVLLIAVLLYLFTYLVGMWRLGMNNDERLLLIAPIRRVLTRRS